MVENKETGLGWKQKVELAVGNGKWIGSSLVSIYAIVTPYDRFTLALAVGWTAHNIGWSLATNLLDRKNELNRPRR